MPAPEPHADLLAEGRDLARRLAKAARAPDMGPVAAAAAAARERLLAALREEAAEAWSEGGDAAVGVSHVAPDRAGSGPNRLADIINAFASAAGRARAADLAWP